MGTRAGSRLYIEGTAHEIGQWVVRLFRARGYQVACDATRLEIRKLDAFLGIGVRQAPYVINSRYKIMWAPAAEGWCLVLGLDDADPQGTAVFASELIALSGRRAIYFGFVDDVWWCKYYVGGVIEDEWGNLHEHRLMLAQALRSLDPNDPRWVTSRTLEELRPVGQNTEEMIQVLRTKLTYPRKAPTGLLEQSDLIRDPYRGHLGLETYSSNQSGFMELLEKALKLNYLTEIHMMVIEMQSWRLSQYPNYVDAFRNGVFGAIFVHPVLQSWAPK